MTTYTAALCGTTPFAEYTFRVRARNRAGVGEYSAPSDEYEFGSPSWGVTDFTGGNISGPSINSIAAGMVQAAETASPTSGGTLTVNGVSLGSYDYVIKKGDQTVSSMNSSEWFTSVKDTRSSWVVVDGDLTIEDGVTFTPPARKLFMVLYVNGCLTVNGSISMKARGANHSGSGNSGGATPKGNIRIAEGAYSTVTDPYIPANGGAKVGPSQSGGGYYTTQGNPGVNGGTGSGGSGTVHNNTAPNSVGSAGTSFTGGSGGGAVRYTGNRLSDSTAAENGGRGGHGWGDNFQASGGAGNPGGNSYTFGGNAGGKGEDGTGGVMVIVATNTFSGSGTVTADGSAPGSTTNIAGSGSGGGSVTIFHGADRGPTPTAKGGVNAGDGTARKLAIA